MVVVGLVSPWRCGGFLGESSAVPGTLSEQLCRDTTGRTLFAVVVLAPAALGLVGTVQAATINDTRRLRVAIAAAAAIPTGVAILDLVCGSL